MSRSYERSYNSQRAHYYPSRRRIVKKASNVSLVMGLLCLAISAVLFGVSFLNQARSQHRMLVMSLIYVCAGLVLLLLRVILEWIQERMHRTRKSASAYHHVSPTAPPRGGSDAPPPGEFPAREGGVLIMVLILLALISALVIQAQVTARAALLREQRAVLQARLRQAATGAAFSALRRIADDEDLQVDHTNEPWATPREEADPSGIVTRTTVIDEDRTFDVNNLVLTAPVQGARAVSDIVMDILTLCGDFAPVARTDALIDWMDGDNDGYAEADAYAELTPPYAPPNRNLETWGEVLWVRGFDRAYFVPHARYSAREVFNANAADCLTVLPGQRGAPLPVNINTAPRGVLLGVLGLDAEDAVAAVLVRRTSDPFRSLDPLLFALKPEVADSVRPYLDVRSHVFRVEAQAYAEGESHRLWARARRDTKGNVQVFEWVF